MITEFIENKCPEQKRVPEISDHTNRYSMFHSGGVETEVGEFLYGLIRLIKPTYVLETGTLFGHSTSYIGLGLKHNKHGKIRTIDIIQRPETRLLLQQLELGDIVTLEQRSSLDWVEADPIDFLFLDSEPHLRFNEFVKFFENVVPGGFIAIHDLHPHLSYMPDVEPINGMKHWPYGDFRKTLGPYISNHEVQTFNFSSPRGFTIFQKCRSDFTSTKLIRGQIDQKDNI